MGVTKEEEKREVRTFEEMLVENVPNLTKYMNLHIQEAQGMQRKTLKRYASRHIIIKL